VDPKLKKEMEDLYPDLKPFFSPRYLKDETVFSVCKEQVVYVDKYGVMHLGTDTFRFMVSAMNEFFRCYKKGVDLRDAFAGFIRLLSGGLYE